MAQFLRHGISVFTVPRIDGSAAACMAINALPLLPLSPAAPLSRMQDIVDYYVQYGEALGTMLVVGSVGAMFLLVFLLGLGTYLRRLQDRPSLLTTGVVTAGVAACDINTIANAGAHAPCVSAGAGVANAPGRYFAHFP